MYIKLCVPIQIANYTTKERDLEWMSGSLEPGD
jgi:hypothetical protein